MNLLITELTDNVLKIEPEVARIDSSVAAKFKEQLLEKRDSFLTAKWNDIKENNIIFNALDLSDSNNLSKEIIPIEKPFLLTSATLALNNKFK